MKRVLSFVLAIAMIFSFAACSNKNAEPLCQHEWESTVEGDTVTFSCKLCNESISKTVKLPEKIVEKEVPVEKEVVKTVVKEVVKEVEVPTYSSDAEKMNAQNYQLLQYYYDRYQKLDALKNYVMENYYTDVKEEDLLEGAYKGLVESLDDQFSVYNSAENSEEYEEALTQSYSGIGIMIRQEDDLCGYIDSVTPNSPAQRAGLKTGDKIVAVDGTSYIGTGIDPIALAIKGEVGTNVRVDVDRNGEILTFIITRQKVGMPTVSYEVLEGGEGYVQLTGFDSVTVEEMKAALKDLEEQGVKKFVLDLRDNGGGQVEVALDVADLLMNAGVMVYTEDRNGNREYYKTNAGRTSMKYVVLCNGGTASAAEMLCAGIQDNNEGKIVGTTTYGKGIVQIFAYINDGSSVSLTQMQYFSPKGHVIHKVGITPDYEVGISLDGVDHQLEKALEVLK